MTQIKNCRLHHAPHGTEYAMWRPRAQLKIQSKYNKTDYHLDKGGNDGNDERHVSGKTIYLEICSIFPPRHSCCCPTNPSNSNCKQTTQTIEYTHNYCYYVFVSQKNELRKIVGCMNSSQTPLCNEYFRANTKVGRTWIDSLEIRRRWFWNIHSLVKFPGICSVRFVTAQSAFAWIELNADKFDATHTHRTTHMTHIFKLDA